MRAFCLSPHRTAQPEHPGTTQGHRATARRPQHTNHLVTAPREQRSREASQRHRTHQEQPRHRPAPRRPDSSPVFPASAVTLTRSPPRYLSPRFAGFLCRACRARGFAVRDLQGPRESVPVEPDEGRKRARTRALHVGRNVGRRRRPGQVDASAARAARRVPWRSSTRRERPRATGVGESFDSGDKCDQRRLFESRLRRQLSQLGQLRCRRRPGGRDASRATRADASLSAACDGIKPRTYPADSPPSSDTR